MTETLPFVIQKYFNSGVVVDTNLMVLYVIGLYDMNLIERHNKTKTYTKDDFLTLYNMLGNFNRIVTTPNILTETSNLTETGDQNFKDNFFTKFGETLNGFVEKYSSSGDLAKEKTFKKFGLADSSISKLALEGHLILTDDFRLSSFLSGQDLPVINFNHIRTYYLMK